MRFRTIVSSTLLLLIASFAHAQQEITVAAASDLQLVMPEIVSRFEKQTADHVKVSYGSSGNFTAQIENGAPFDVFLSADRQYPEKLQQAGLIEPGTIRNYVIGKLVLWVPAASTIDLNRGLKALADPSVRKVAIANPEHAPYGRAAVAALRHEGLYESVAKKFVLGENISQAATFVTSGNADAGLLSLSLASAPSMKERGRYVEIPADDYPRLDQAAVILSSSKNKNAAREFLDFLSSPPVAELLRKYGFSIPSEPANPK